MRKYTLKFVDSNGQAGLIVGVRAKSEKALREKFLKTTAGLTILDVSDIGEHVMNDPPLSSSLWLDPERI